MISNFLKSIKFQPDFYNFLNLPVLQTNMTSSTTRHGVNSIFSSKFGKNKNELFSSFLPFLAKDRVVISKNGCAQKCSDKCRRNPLGDAHKVFTRIGGIINLAHFATRFVPLAKATRENKLEWIGECRQFGGRWLSNDGKCASQMGEWEANLCKLSFEHG